MFAKIWSVLPGGGHFLLIFTFGVVIAYSTQAPNSNNNIINNDIKSISDSNRKSTPSRLSNNNNPNDQNSLKIGSSSSSNGIPGAKNDISNVRNDISNDNNNVIQKKNANSADTTADKEMCWRVFDTSNRTIIKTTDSLNQGAKYIKSTKVSSRTECMLACCRADGCNMAIMQEKVNGDCYLFDCGTLEDFKCTFSSHDDHVAMGMMVDRADFARTQSHEPAKHEMDLNLLKTSARQKTAANGQQVQQQQKVQQKQQAQNSQQQLSQNSQQQSQGESPNNKQSVQQAYSAPVPNNDANANYLTPKPNNGKNRPMKQPRRIFNQNSTISTPQFSPCSSAQWQCESSGECIAVYDRCDGIKQCSDQSDEKYCDLNPADQQRQQNQQQTKINNVQGQPAANNGPPPIWGQYYPPDQPQQPPDQEQQPYFNSGQNFQQNKYLNGQQQQVKQNFPYNQQQQQQYQQTYDQPNNGFWQQQQPKQQNFASNGQQQQQWSGRDGYRGNQAASGQQQFNWRPRLLHKNDGIVDEAGERLAPSSRPQLTPESSLSGAPGTNVAVSIEHLDYGRGGTSLAAVMLGLGLAILALLLMFISCRLRKARRRLRRGKVLNADEGEYLINGLYL